MFTIFFSLACVLHAPPMTLNCDRDRPRTPAVKDTQGHWIVFLSYIRSWVVCIYLLLLVTTLKQLSLTSNKKMRINSSSNRRLICCYSVRSHFICVLSTLIFWNMKQKTWRPGDSGRVETELLKSSICSRWWRSFICRVYQKPSLRDQYTNYDTSK
jgi:hypothetical protein